MSNLQIKIDGLENLIDQKDEIIAAQQALLEQLMGVSKKVLLAFPDVIPADKEQIEFNIPAYIIEELRVAVAAAKKGDSR